MLRSMTMTAASEASFCCLQSFDATDAAFRTGYVLYNLLADFRETELVGADLIARERRVQIRFAVPQDERPEFLRRLRTVRRFTDCAVGMVTVRSSSNSS